MGDEWTDLQAAGLEDDQVQDDLAAPVDLSDGDWTNVEMAEADAAAEPLLTTSQQRSEIMSVDGAVTEGSDRLSVSCGGQRVFVAALLRHSLSVSALRLHFKRGGDGATL